MEYIHISIKKKIDKNEKIRCMKIKIHVKNVKI